MHPEGKKSPPKQEQNELCKQGSDVLWNAGQQRSTNHFSSSNAELTQQERAANATGVLTARSGHSALTAETRFCARGFRLETGAGNEAAKGICFTR